MLCSVNGFEITGRMLFLLCINQENQTLEYDSVIIFAMSIFITTIGFVEFFSCAGFRGRGEQTVVVFIGEETLANVTVVYNEQVTNVPAWYESASTLKGESEAFDRATSDVGSVGRPPQLDTMEN